MASTAVAHPERIADADHYTIIFDLSAMIYSRFFVTLRFISF